MVKIKFTKKEEKQIISGVKNMGHIKITHEVFKGWIEDLEISLEEFGSKKLTRYLEQL